MLRPLPPAEALAARPAQCRNTDQRRASKSVRADSEVERNVRGRPCSHLAGLDERPPIACCLLAGHMTWFARSRPFGSQHHWHIHFPSGEGGSGFGSRSTAGLGVLGATLVTIAGAVGGRAVAARRAAAPRPQTPRSTLSRAADCRRSSPSSQAVPAPGRAPPESFALEVRQRGGVPRTLTSFPWGCSGTPTAGAGPSNGLLQRGSTQRQLNS